MHRSGESTYSLSFSPTQTDVKSPKCSRHSCAVTWSLSGLQDEIKAVELLIETAPAAIDGTPGDKCSSGLLMPQQHKQVVDCPMNQSYRKPAPVLTTAYLLFQTSIRRGCTT